jgi:hypothetical protein
MVGNFTTTIPVGFFTGKGYNPFHFEGTINGAALEVSIVPTGAKRYDFDAMAQNVNLTGTVNPVGVMLAIGDNAGTVFVNAQLGLRTNAAWPFQLERPCFRYPCARSNL